MDPDVHELHARQLQPPVIAAFVGVDSSMKSAHYSGVLGGSAQTTSSLLTSQVLVRELLLSTVCLARGLLKLCKRDFQIEPTAQDSPRLQARPYFPSLDRRRA